MTDQLTTARDQIAEMCGIVLIRKSHTESQPRHPRTWVIPDVRAWCEPDHPIPACLNFVSRVWPDEPYHTEVSDMMPEFYGISTHEARLEYWMSRLRDAFAWLRDHDRPAFDAACEKIRKECGK